MRVFFSFKKCLFFTFQFELGTPRTNTSGQSLTTYTHLVIYVLPLCNTNYNN